MELYTEDPDAVGEYTVLMTVRLESFPTVTTDIEVHVKIDLTADPC